LAQFIFGGRTNEGEHLSPKGDNRKSVKIHFKSLKTFSRTTGPNSIKLGINHPWVKGIQVCSNTTPDLLQKGVNHNKRPRGHIAHLSHIG
jgi:hypothetical protein